jgi:hypothetical protein
MVLLDYSEKLMNRYNAFTFVKWIYLFGFLMVIPFWIWEFSAVTGGVPIDIMENRIVVVFSTF